MGLKPSLLSSLLPLGQPEYTAGLAPTACQKGSGNVCVERTAAWFFRHVQLAAVSSVPASSQHQQSSGMCDSRHCLPGCGQKHHTGANQSHQAPSWAREVMDSPVLEVFKRLMDMALWGMV